MRSPKYFSLIAIIFFLSLLISPTLALADRGTVQLLVDPFGSQDIAGVHVASDGSLFVLDRADEIFKIDPETGDYEGFSYLSGYDLSDMTLQDAENAWWADGSQMFGSLNTGNQKIETWDVSNAFEDLPQFGPLVYDQGDVWLADSISSYYGFYRFNPLNNQLCMYENPINGIHAADLALHDGYIWALDWSLDALMRINPGDGQLVKILLGREIGIFDANLQSDGTYLWLTQDVDDGEILRYNPETLILTVYDLPAGEHPRHLSLGEDGTVWYTNKTGSFGKLDPGLFSSTEVTLTAVTIKSSITPQCEDLGSPDLWDAIYETGSLADPPTTFDSTSTTPLAGLQSFSLNTDAQPFGIAVIQDYVWVTDPFRDELVRLPLEPQSDGNFIYLPLIIR